MFGKLLDAEHWGGIVTAPGARDFIAALKVVASAEAEVITFRPGDRDNVREMLNRAVDQAWVDRSVLVRWDKYASAREGLLQYTGALTDHPLMVLMGDEKLLERAERMLSAYEEALKAVKETSDALKDRGSIEPAKRLLARMLVLDVVFVRSGKEMNAIAAPTHPFHVWRWATLVRMLKDRVTDFKDLGVDVLKEIVIEPPPASPSLLLSPFVKDVGIDRSRAFVCVGCFGALPLFSEPGSRL